MRQSNANQQNPIVLYFKSMVDPIYILSSSIGCHLLIILYSLNKLKNQYA